MVAALARPGRELAKQFAFSGARAAKKVAASFFTGEALKILITVALFSLVYMYIQVELVPLKLTYLLALGINICAPVLFINNNKRSKLLECAYR